MKIKKRGFTLVELIIVIAILGILTSLTGLGIPAYQNFADKNKLKVETRMLRQTFLKARMDAIVEGYEQRIYISPDKNRFLIKKLSCPGDPPAQVLDLSNDISINSTTFIGKANLSFKPIGTVARGGHITLRSPKGKYMTIVIQIGTGRIYMKEGRIDD